jgi:DNA-binding MarR family transcriptional regulator
VNIEQAIKQDKFSSEYHRLAVNILYTASWIENEHRQMLKPYGLTVTQFNVLRILRGQKGNPISVLGVCERMLDRSSNASRIIDKLISQGLVDRKVCVQDRRQVDVVITSKGLRLINDTDKLSDEMEKLVSCAFTNEQANAFSGLLDRIRNLNK